MSFDYSKEAELHYNNMSYTTTTTTTTSGSSDEETMNSCMDGMKRGPWTEEEDIALVNYISVHGEGRWNSLARCAGLNRTGKSCRLRWLNYLRPDVRRGNITPEEQLLILELHSRWGNRWSKIAQYLPGRTDNEIKNYWRTRVQKHAKQLKCDVNSQQFKDTMRYLWMPRLVEKIQAQAQAATSSSVDTTTPPTTIDVVPSSTTVPFNQHVAGGGDFSLQQQQYSNNWQYSAHPNYSTIAASSDNSSTSNSINNQLLAVSPPSTTDDGGDYNPYPTYNITGAGIAAATTDQNMNHDQVDVDSLIMITHNSPSGANYTFNNDDQYLSGLDNFQWLDDVDLWNSIDSYNHHLLQHQHQKFNGANNQINSYPVNNTSLYY